MARYFLTEGLSYSERTTVPTARKKAALVVMLGDVLRWFWSGK
jgi:hypothetical protein